MDEDDISRLRRPTGRSRSMSDEDDVLRVRRRSTGRSRSVDKINSHVREPGTTDLRENFYGPRETSLGLIDGVACSETISQDESSSRPDYIYTDLNDNDVDQGFYEGFDEGLYEDEDQGFDEGFDEGLYEDEDQGFDEGLYEDEDEDQGFDEGFDEGLYEDEDQGFDEGLYEGLYEDEDQGFDEDEDQGFDGIFDEDEIRKTEDPSMLKHLKYEDESLRPHDIPLQELKEITDNFSDERILGQGGFGVVYKGVLPNGKMIAVKKIVSSLMPGMQKQFESEVYHLMSLKHANIVRFVGYCYEIKNACLEYNGKYVFAEMAEKLLCFEYLPKGSLNKYISDESSGLDWSTRYKIIEGICYGLRHLHEQIDKPIIHLDLKPANILLNDSLVPKITDFGMSRLLGQQQTIYTSSLIGTFGYMAPEFLHGGTITPMSDIFSLGVIIMELVTGHRDYPDVTRAPSDDFIELTISKWRNVLQRSPGYGSLETHCEQIRRCLQVGLICVNPDRTKRPSITKVINMLQGSESIDCAICNEATTQAASQCGEPTLV